MISCLLACPPARPSATAQYPSNHDRPAVANLEPVPCAANASHTCGIKGYILDLLKRGMPASKISAGLSISGLPGQIGCGAARDGCGTVGGCNASYDPDGAISGSGWTKASLRDFLNFLDTHSVVSIDIWTGDAFELPESVAICHWLIDELRLWRHPKPAGKVLEESKEEGEREERRPQ
jgi:hypothetical protein